MLAAFGAAGAITGLSPHYVYAAGALVLGGALFSVRRQALRFAALQRQERALRKEVLAYLLFNGSPKTMARAELGRQISRLIAVRSSFPRAALLLRRQDGVLAVAGSAGIDDLSVEALNRWGGSVSDQDLSPAEIAAAGQRVATTSFTVQLDRRCMERNPLSTMSCKEVHIVPLRTAQGLLGALAVCTEPRATSHLVGMPELSRHPEPADSLTLADLLQPLEALALRLTMELGAPENVTPVWPARPASRQPRPPVRAAAHSGQDSENPDRSSDQSSDRSSDRPDRCDRSGRRSQRNQSRDRQPRDADRSSRRSLDDAAVPLRSESTAQALENIRQILNPEGAPLERVAGVSGRPPSRIWRASGGAPSI